MKEKVMAGERKLRNQLPYFSGIILGILFLVYVFHGVDFHQLYVSLSEGKWGYLFPLVGTIFLFYWLKAKRWHYLLDPVVKIDTKKLIPTTIVGAAVNFVLFGYVGEFVKCYLLGEQVKKSKSMIFGTIVLERVFDLLTVVLFLGVALTFTTVEELDISKIGPIVTILGLLIVAMLIVCIRYRSFAMKMIEKVLLLFPSRFRETILKEVEFGINGLLSISNPKLLLGVIVTSVVQWLVMASTSYFAFLAVNIDVPFYAAIIVMSLIIMGMLLPNSPGHIGMIEFCFVVGLKPYQVPLVKALAAAMIYHLVLYGLVICVGGVMLRYWHLSFSGVAKKGEELADPLLHKDDTKEEIATDDDSRARK